MRPGEATDHFVRAFMRAAKARRGQFSVPGEVAIGHFKNEALQSQHAALIAEGYAIPISVPCRFLVGLGLSVTFEYRHADKSQPTMTLRLVTRVRRRVKRR